MSHAVTSPDFVNNSKKAIADPVLQTALDRMTRGFPVNRRRAVEALPEFDSLRDEAKVIKDHALAHLDLYLEAFEKKVIESGGHVHWCLTPDEARATITRLVRDGGGSLITKGKSMVTEELGLNAHLEKEGFKPLETDLGEYIIQLANEPPSHILGPAIHMPKERIADIFVEHHTPLGFSERKTTPEELVAEARTILREKYFQAKVAITGANFLVAETGSAIIVTNEGNGDLSQTLADTHIVVTGIEKVIPTLEDAATLLRVLARSATGQEMSVYTTLATGPRRPGDTDGPGTFHVVLVDNGRSQLLASPAKEALRCIRCAACLNHCPIYKAVGGHAYGWVYSGPIGAAIDPAYLGLNTARHLPNASTLCGRCEEVCPVRIPLPKIFRYWRTEAFKQGLTPGPERQGVRLWAYFAKRPKLYRLWTRTAARVLAAAGRGKGRLRHVVGFSGWTNMRDLPAPEGKTFFEQWKNRE